MNKIKEKIKKEGDRIRNEIREKTTGYLLTALGLVAALAWNDAVISLINFLFPFNKDSILIKFIYAIVITFIIVIISVYFTLLVKKKEI
jgi:hypothetical protein